MSSPPDSFVRKTVRLLIVVAVCACVLFAASAAGLLIWANRPLTLALTQKEHDVTIKPGSSLRSVTRQLNENGVRVNRIAFEIMARVLHLSTSLKSGNYAFDPGMTPHALLLKLARGDVNQFASTIIEGWTFARMRSELDANTHLTHASAGMSDAALMSAIGLPGEAPEGRFFPDTYLFDAQTSDLDVYRRAYHEGQVKLAEIWAARAPHLPLNTPYDALILASLVEKETGRSGERAQVAAVFINRLRIGMALQTDPSVIYGLTGQLDGRLRKKDLQTDTPYNTYTRRGLPPTPIALPGIAALQAATHPAVSSALYFVARGDGSSLFSDTLDEHNRAVDKYQRGQ